MTLTLRDKIILLVLLFSVSIYLGYMAVMNLDFAYIACLWGNNENDFTYRYVERDYDFEEEIIETEQHFWEEYIQKKVEPPFVEKPDMVMDCLKKYTEPADMKLSKMALPNSFEADLIKLVALKDKKSKLDAEVRMLDSEIKQLSVPIIESMGPVCESELSVPGKRFYVSYKPQTRTCISADKLKKLAIHHKSVYDEYVSTSESRCLKVKEMKVS